MAAKEINDPVWKTIGVSPFEIIILDSPILQRLRSITQLGVVHWVYPGATHTRLEHSLGTLLQAERLMEAFRRTASSAPLPDEWVNFLRLAALCHDVGHGVMSHVSENALNLASDTQDLLEEVEARIAKVTLSEAAAYFILGSPAFRRLCIAARSMTDHRLPINYLDVLPNAIVGKQIFPRYPLLQEVISGPFDADKLDYMTRDAVMTGIPVVTDIPRLIQKVRLPEIEKGKLPEELAASISEAHPSYFVQALALSGARTLDELLLGRTLLFDKVYRHQKVRATEGMVANILLALLPLLARPARLVLPLLMEDHDLLDISRGALAERLGIPLTDDVWASISPIEDLSNALRTRRLFVRAYAFAHHMPRDPFASDDLQKSGLEAAYREIRKPEARAQLLDEVVQELTRIRTLVPRVAWGAIQDRHLTFYLALDPPARPVESDKTTRAFLVSEGELLRFREDSAESPAWSNAYLLARDLGYVFSDKRLAPAVYLACEVVFRRRYEIRTPESARSYAKADETEIRELRGRLTSSGYYNGLPNDLRAEAARLRKMDIPAAVREIVERLGSFEGVSSGTARGSNGGRVSSQRVMAWLRQFPTDDGVDAAVQLLRAIRVVSRADVREGIRHFLATNPGLQNAYVCPLGSPKDSSSILTYYVKDISEQPHLYPSTLEQALAGEERPILFVDDFIGSGGQSRTIVNGWFGQKAEDDIAEDHGPPLSADLQARLQGRKLGFLFICGEEGGLASLRTTTKTHSLDAICDRHLRDDDLPRAFDGKSVRFATSTLSRQFAKTCGEIGRQLLKSKGYGPDSLLDERALGYGNKAYLVAFPYNVPAQTLTLIWAGGRFENWEWLPILPRRQKR